MGRASMAWTSLDRAGCVSEVASVYLADYSEASTEWIGVGRRTAEFLELVGPGSVPWWRLCVCLYGDGVCYGNPKDAFLRGGKGS